MPHVPAADVQPSLACFWIRKGVRETPQNELDGHVWRDIPEKLMFNPPSRAVGASMTLYKRVNDPIILGNDQPFVKGHGDSRLLEIGETQLLLDAELLAIFFAELLADYAILPSICSSALEKRTYSQ